MNISKILFSLALGTLSSTCFADLNTHKPNTIINFNQMIEANQEKASELKEELAQEGFGVRPKEISNSKKKVYDLIDAELGWGEAPQVVDRRFN
ncbi:MAG TPA: hypothetical protein DCL41_05800 [Bdellovibrionales bacterium]|nr:hypothetical protein [Pseudobdellovibrionaceae bacterium]HAG91363.1 hypothetical protein [Bdellovibrionales bacterium]|tara:strand:- start:217 stop:498 length:282 start_codon:yes stop_codon:yes gene_type:complete